MAKNNEFGAVCAELLSRIRDKHPLVHHITNFVVMNDTANLTLALGGRLSWRMPKRKLPKWSGSRVRSC